MIETNTDANTGRQMILLGMMMNSDFFSDTPAVIMNSMATSRASNESVKWTVTLTNQTGNPSVEGTSPESGTSLFNMPR